MGTRNPQRLKQNSVSKKDKRRFDNGGNQSESTNEHDYSNSFNIEYDINSLDNEIKYRAKLLLLELLKPRTEVVFDDFGRKHIVTINPKSDIVKFALSYYNRVNERP